VHGRMDLVAVTKLNEENLYTAPLSLKDELPRLAAQTRILYLEQQARLRAVQFPPAPAKLLDVGAGPGVYLSLLKRQPQFRGYEVTGLDLSPQMVFYARLNRPEIRWIHANVYCTGEPDQSYDVVHSNIVFLHLLNPALALREIHRILKPNGVFYILDGNDARFEGPPAIATLMQKHADLYMGNRRIMSALPHIAEQHGLHLTQRFVTRAKSTSTHQEALVQGDDVLINRIMFWGLFSFLGQREELAAEFKDAQEAYFNSDSDISVCLETHVYKRLDNP
jgi:ubiquinone/menaquinone biosynthesis C-methylase UbiE